MLFRTECDAPEGETVSAGVVEVDTEGAGIPGPVAAGEVIIATDEHSFWVSDLREWVEAVDLAPGMWLQTSAGTWVQINAIQVWSQPATVHNLTVQGVHTYHVFAGSLSSLVHNSNCPTGGSGENGNGFDLPEVRTRIGNKKQGRHVQGAREYDGGSYLNSHEDAQAVLDAYHGGGVEVLGVTKANHILIRYSGITGFDNNPRQGRYGVPTNIFMIKGTRSPSIVPTNPNWSGM